MDDEGGLIFSRMNDFDEQVSPLYAWRRGFHFITLDWFWSSKQKNYVPPNALLKEALVWYTSFKKMLRDTWLVVNQALRREDAAVGNIPPGHSADVQQNVAHCLPLIFYAFHS